MNLPQRPLFELCEKPYLKPCLSLEDILSGRLRPCEICRPHLERARTLLKSVEASTSGYGGVTKEGRVVDRRDHPDATSIPANRLLNIPKPKRLP